MGAGSETFFLCEEISVALCFKVYSHCLKVFTAATKFLKKASRGRKSYLAYSSILLFISKKKSGPEIKQSSNLEAGTVAEVMEGYYLMTCFPWFAQSVFL